MVPAAQRVCSTLPVGLKKPGSVGVHSAALVRLVAFEWLPLLHGVGIEAPLGQTCPGVHGKHAIAPDAGWWLPPGHGHFLLRWLHLLLLLLVLLLLFLLLLLQLYMLEACTVARAAVKGKYALVPI